FEKRPQNQGLDREIDRGGGVTQPDKRTRRAGFVAHGKNAAIGRNDFGARERGKLNRHVFDIVEILENVCIRRRQLLYCFIYHYLSLALFRTAGCGADTRIRNGSGAHDRVTSCQSDLALTSLSSIRLSTPRQRTTISFPWRAMTGGAFSWGDLSQSMTASPLSRSTPTASNKLSLGSASWASGKAGPVKGIVRTSTPRRSLSHGCPSILISTSWGSASVRISFNALRPRRMSSAPSAFLPFARRSMSVAMRPTPNASVHKISSLRPFTTIRLKGLT